MKETGKERFILTKAYEVAYALFRLAAQMREIDFAESLRASGTALLSAAAAEDYAAAARSLRVVECLVKFGGDVGMIGTPNVDVLTREIFALDAAIAERKTAAKTDEVNVAEIFSKPEVCAAPAGAAHRRTGNGIGADAHGRFSRAADRNRARRKSASTTSASTTSAFK